MKKKLGANILCVVLACVLTLYRPLLPSSRLPSFSLFLFCPLRTARCLCCCHCHLSPLHTPPRLSLFLQKAPKAVSEYEDSGFTDDDVTTLRIDFQSKLIPPIRACVRTCVCVRASVRVCVNGCSLIPSLPSLRLFLCIYVQSLCLLTKLSHLGSSLPFLSCPCSPLLLSSSSSSSSTPPLFSSTLLSSLPSQTF